jgi:hypothetical protein
MELIKSLLLKQYAMTSGGGSSAKDEFRALFGSGAEF